MTAQNLILGDEAFSLGAALLRMAWWSANARQILAPPKAGQTFALRQRQIEIVVLVDDVERGLRTTSGHRRPSGALAPENG